MTIRCFLFLLVFFPLPAFAENYTCPDAPKSGQTVSYVPQGWISSTLTTNIPQENGLTVFDGPPLEMASLVPDNEGAAENARWTFAADRSRPIWMQCHYAGEAMHFGRMLSDSVSGCTQTDKQTLSCE